jgi:tetratricopeptide (TPR) repeat protein
MDLEETKKKLEKITIFGMGSHEEGLRLCEDALKEYPDNKDMLLFKTNCLVRLERFKEAITLFDILIEKDPKYADVYRQRRFECIADDQS